MKYLACALLILLASCTAIVDTRSEPERAATATAKANAPLPPLNELGGVLRIVLERPPIDIAPAVVPNEASLLPTVTPEVSE